MVNLLSNSLNNHIIYSKRHARHGFEKEFLFQGLYVDLMIQSFIDDIVDKLHFFSVDRMYLSGKWFVVSGTAYFVVGTVGDP